MYDELLNKTPQSQFYNVKLVKHGPISASQRSLNRSTEKIMDGKAENTGTDNGPSSKFQNSQVVGNRNAEKPPSNGLFHFRRKQGGVKSNERGQSPRASSKQLLAKQNLSRLTKPFAKNTSAHKSQDKNNVNTTHEKMTSITTQNTEQTARAALVPSKINSQSSHGRNQRHVESLIKQVNSSQQQ